MKILRYKLKNDALWQLIYHLPLIGFGVIAALIIWFLSFGEN